MPEQFARALCEYAMPPQRKIMNWQQQFAHNPDAIPLTLYKESGCKWCKKPRGGNRVYCSAECYLRARREPVYRTPEQITEEMRAAHDALGEVVDP